AEGLQMALIGFIAAAFFLSRTFVPTLYLIIGLAAALAVIARQSGRSIPLPPLPLLALIVLACGVRGIGLVYAIVKLQLACACAMVTSQLRAGPDVVTGSASLREFGIIYFGNDWFAENRTSSHHVAERLSERTRVLYVDSPGLRAPKANARDLRK